MKRKIDYVKQAFREGNLYPKLICYFLEKLGLSSETIRRLQLRNYYYRKLKKEYYSKIDQEVIDLKLRQGNNIVWFFWDDGLENAPQLVKRCYANLKKFKPTGYEVVLLNKSNMEEYVDIPQYVLDKYRRGCIPSANFSDILRLLLLVQYGGIWMDATVYLSSNLDDFKNLDQMFVFSNEYRNDDIINFDNWFIVAKPNNLLLKKTLNLLLMYWKKENVLREYFICHLFFKMVTEKYPQEWEDTNKLTTLLPHSLYHMQYEVFNKEKLKKDFELCCVHKMSYKNLHTNYKNTYLDAVMKGITYEDLC